MSQVEGCGAVNEKRHSIPKGKRGNKCIPFRPVKEGKIKKLSSETISSVFYKPGDLPWD